MRSAHPLSLFAPLLLVGCLDKDADDDPTDDTGDTHTTSCGSTEGFVYGQVLGPYNTDPNPYATVHAVNVPESLNEDAEMDGTGGYELNVSEGEWTLYASDDWCWSPDHVVDVVACEETELDIKLTDCDTTSADKPNLYLYPGTDRWTSVQLRHSERQRVFASEPDYGPRGWRGMAHPDGTFTTRDGLAPFLFYEITLLPWQNRRLQRAEGWCLPEEGAVDAMAELLGDYGFDAREREDFVEAWALDLPANEGGYAVYPQLYVDDLALVDIQPALALSRIWLLVEDGQGCTMRSSPTVVPFDRSGAHAVEWGVVLNDLVR